MYNNSNIDQLGICLVWSKHKGKVVRRFFVVQGDHPVLLGLPDMELVGLIKIICKVLDQQ